MTFAPVAIMHANPKIAQLIMRWLDAAGYSTQWCADLLEETSKIDITKFGLIIADENAPCKNGLPICEFIKSKGFSVPVILLTDKATVQRAVEVIKMGVMDYLSTPIDEGVLLGAVAKAQATHESGSKELCSSTDAKCEFITKSKKMQHILEIAQRVAPSSATVLIEGESGTGKELLARHIHMRSDRKNQPFVAMNCAALPENLAESELFGYDKGAFTGASKTRSGKFEQAHQGTLLLDEISEMPLVLQAKLLRVLQEKEVDHLGGGKPIKVNVRCIATSNQSLSQMVKAGKFRKDLYYRLKVIPLSIPPLRERVEDIHHLLAHFIRKFQPNNGGTIKKFDDKCLEYLQQWHWPGNVRELENTVERALLINKGPIINKASLFLDEEMGSTDNEGSDYLVGMTVKDVEKKLIGQTLSHLNQNRTHAAKMLGISIRTLRNKLRDYQENEGELNHDM